MMREMVVKTKEDFKRATELHPEKIIFQGEMAEVVRKAVQRKKVSKGVAIGSGLLALGGIIAAPFTAGASLGATGAALGSAGLASFVTAAGATAATTTAVSLSTVAVGAGVCGALAGFGIGLSAKEIAKFMKSYKVMKFGKNGISFEQ